MGLKDSRDAFPIFISAVKQVQPEIWVFENVRGVLYSNRWYFEQILEALKALNYVSQHAASPLQKWGAKKGSRLELIEELLLVVSEQVRAFCSDDSKFFLRNLGTVQGDEMDRIILSLTYGKMPAENSAQQFLAR